MKGIVEATHDYEDWVRRYVPLDPSDLDYKHQQMRASSFSFLRATFYRWMQVFPKACDQLTSAPKVLAIGDLHAENFGTWRDAEGRLIWGINDFDEAAVLPFTVDLVRLATSLQLAIDSDHLKTDIEDACESLIAGYTKSLESGGSPFVLAEEHGGLRRLATGELRNPVSFWDKMNDLPAMRPEPMAEGVSALTQALPSPDMDHELKSRRAGLGSLGRPRYVALATWHGGKIAREAKALAPSGAVWAKATHSDATLLYPDILGQSVRCLDPFVRLNGIWLVRRLAPDCSRIELAQLPAERDELRLVEAMGRETGNIHLGSQDSTLDVLKHLGKLPKKWLKKACQTMSEEVRDDFKKYRESPHA